MENCWGDEAAKVKAECGMSLREAVTLINTAALEDNGDSFRECDGNTNYRTGEVETRTLHLPDNVTPASYERVRRLLGMRD